MKRQKVRTAYVNAEKLIPYEKNPRSWSKKATKDLKESIKKFGLIDPVICNSAQGRKNVVLGGNFRLKCAKELGITEIPVTYVNIKDSELEREICLRLNSNTGDWDFEILKEFKIDMLLDVGFDSKDLSPIWKDLLGTENDDINIEEEMSKIKESRIKEGEIYQLGIHRLACGNSMDNSLVKSLAGKDKATIIYCDPPYNISLDYDKGFGNKSKYGGHVNDNKPEREYKNLIMETIENGLAVSQKDVHIYYFCDENYIWLIQQSYKDLGIKLKRVCLWVKNSQNPTSQTAFNKSYEPIVYGIIGEPFLNPINNLTEVLNKEVGTGNDTIDDINDISNLWTIKRLPGNKYEHPTEKPVTLHEKPLMRCSKPGDVVLDLFGGSGSTLIACEQLKRKALLVEMSPVFCELIIRRFEKLTGTKAKKILEV